MITKAKIKHIIDLQDSAYRKEKQEYVVEGEKNLKELVNSNVKIIKEIFYTEKFSKADFIEDLLAIMKHEKFSLDLISDSDMKKISSLDTPPGILSVVKKTEEKIIPNESILVLDQIKDPGNMGTIIRTADWFGIKNIVLGRGCVDAYNPKVVQSTMGSIFHVKILTDVDLKSFINDYKNKLPVVVTVLEDGFEPKKINGPFILVMGSESHGVSKDIISAAKFRFTIKGLGSAESLNVSVATGIILNSIN